MAGLLDPRNGDGTWVENRPSKASQLWGIAEPYVMGPWNAWKGLMDADLDTLLYDTGPKGQQAVENAFNVAGTVTGGSSVVPKPDDALNMGIKAFHGSPHDFDRFSLDKIGTGEGAQAYGHGLYFAENEGIAKHYRDALTSGAGSWTVDGQNLAKLHMSTNPTDRLKYEIGIAARQGMSPEEAIDYVAQQKRGKLNSRRTEPENIPYLHEDIAALEQMRSAPPAIAKEGKMYEVEIDADPEQFLDWDKPLSADTPKAMRDAFNSVANSDPALREQFHQAFRENQPGSIYYSILNDRAKTGDLVKNQTYATERLREAGIPGIKYLDAGSRYTPANLPDNPIANEARQFLDAAQGNADTALRLFRESNPVERWAGSERDEITQVIKAAAKPVTRNYVVFDDNLINIIRKYGIAGLLGGSAALNAMTAEPQEQY